MPTTIRCLWPIPRPPPSQHRPSVVHFAIRGARDADGRRPARARPRYSRTDYCKNASAARGLPSVARTSAARGPGVFRPAATRQAHEREGNAATTKVYETGRRYHLLRNRLTAVCLLAAHPVDNHGTCLQAQQHSQRLLCVRARVRAYVRLSVPTCLFACQSAYLPLAFAVPVPASFFVYLCLCTYSNPRCSHPLCYPAYMIVDTINHRRNYCRL